MNGMETIVIRGRFNRVTFGLGLGAVVMGIVGAWVTFGVGYVDAQGVGMMFGGLFLGGLVLYEAVVRRRTGVVLSPAGIEVDGEAVPLTAVQAVIEKDIHRYLKTWVGRFHLRRVRRLEIYTAVFPYPLTISDEWLTAVDYTAATAWLAAHFIITHEQVTEEG